jgi:hypothetical protein
MGKQKVSGATNEVGAPASRIIVLTPRHEDLKAGTWTRGHGSKVVYQLRKTFAHTIKPPE